MPPNPAVVAAVLGGVGVLGGISSGKAAQRAAQREAAYKLQLFEQAKFFGAAALARLTLETHTQRRQQDDLLARQLEQAASETGRRAGTIAASAGGAGVAGASVALELAETEKALNDTRGGVRLQKEFLDVGAELSLRSGRMSIRERVTAAFPSPTSVPSNAAIALGAISSGLSLAAAGSDFAGLFGKKTG